MIKKLLLLALLTGFITLFFIFSSSLKGEYQSFSNSIKISIQKALNGISDSFFSLIRQSEQIKECETRARSLEKYKILYKDLLEKHKNLLKECGVKKERVYDLELASAISYVRLGDFTTLWLDFPPPKEILGALKEEYVAGILRPQEGKSVLYLNGSKKCSYGVELVKSGAKGIAVGSGDNRYIFVKYIANYEPIAVGEEVITNGLDNIFPYGIKVGKVEKIWSEGSYKVAEVECYAKLERPFYFWIILKDKTLSNIDIN